MTAECGGGASEPKPGFQNPVYFTTAAIGAFFNALPSPWLLDFVSYLGPQNVDPSEFCLVDPPADPGMTALDFANVLKIGNLGLQTPALFKLAQLFRRYLWFQICQCAAAPQPTPPAAPVPPSGLVDVDPPSLTPPIAPTPCVTTTAYNGAVSSGFSVAGNTIVLPAGASSVLLRITILGTTSGVRNTNITLESLWQTASGSNILNVGEIHTITPSMNAPLEFVTHIPANGARLAYQVGVVGGAWAAFLHADHVVYCGGVTPTGTPCDQTVDLSALLALMEYMKSQIDLIQRQSVPFAYVDGDVHSGLTGNGEVSVNPILGIRVLITDTSSGVGVTEGDPDTYWQAGWLRWGDANGFSERRFIDASPLTWFPQPAGQFTRVGYSLPPGVEIEIRELVREP